MRAGKLSGAGKLRGGRIFHASEGAFAHMAFRDNACPQKRGPTWNVKKPLRCEVVREQMCKRWLEGQGRRAPTLKMHFNVPRGVRDLAFLRESEKATHPWQMLKPLVGVGA